MKGAILIMVAWVMAVVLQAITDLSLFESFVITALSYILAGLNEKEIKE